MSFSSDSRSRIVTSRLDRRRLMKGTAAVGAGAALASFGMRGMSDVSAQTVLNFYHDKQPWQDFFVQMGNSAEAAIGINWEPTPYADTTSYQAAVLASLPTSDAPDFIHLVVWLPYRGPLQPGRAARCF